MAVEEGASLLLGPGAFSISLILCVKRDQPSTFQQLLLPQCHNFIPLQPHEAPPVSDE